MPDYRRRTCRRCGKRDTEVGAISWRGLCVGCATTAVAENVIGLHTKTGVPLRRWRRGMAASVGAVLLDDIAPSGHTRDDGGGTDQP